jgi:hypothetical protein
MKIPPNDPAATNPALTAVCYTEAQLRRFVDPNRWAKQARFDV